MRPKSFLKYLFNPFMLAGLFSCIVIYLLPDYFPKYTLQPAKSRAINKPDAFVMFMDLNGDKKSEEILSFSNTENRHSIQIIDYQGKLLEQYDLNGQVAKRGIRIILHTLNKSRNIELYTFSQRLDSLFLIRIQLFKNPEHLFREIFITKVFRSRLSEYDYKINGGTIASLSDKDTLQLVFGVMAGYSVEPRKVFLYDMLTEEICSSQELGVPCDITEISDGDKNGSSEIFLGDYAPQNMPAARVGFPNDIASWLIVLNSDLSLSFPPVQYKGFTSSVSSYSFIFHKIPGIIAVYNSWSYTKADNCMDFYDYKGKAVIKVILPAGTNTTMMYYRFLKRDSISNRLFFINSVGTVLYLDENLTIHEIKKFDDFQLSQNFVSDLDNDNSSENIILGNSNQSLIVDRNDFSYPVRIEVPNQGNFISYSVRYFYRENSDIALQFGNLIYFIRYAGNSYYWFRYIFYLGIFLTLSALFYSVQYIQRTIFREKIRAKTKISELQVLLLKDQLEPHFSFNAITSIASLIAENRNETALKKIDSFSDLLRSFVSTSENIVRSISDELAFVGNYIELEKDKMDDRFTYSVKIEDGVNLETLIPKMLIQIHVENAIKHGLKPKKYEGKIEIVIQSVNKQIIILITDDGIGRRSKASDKLSLGRSTHLFDQLINTFNSFNKKKLLIEYSDLYKNFDTPVGTTVRITVPENYNYSFYNA
jgi:two-component sensor histidine kinase